MMSDSDDLWRAFIAGFQTSSQRFNSDMMVVGDGIYYNIEDDEPQQELKEAFQNWMNQR